MLGHKGALAFNRETSVRRWLLSSSSLLGLALVSGISPAAAQSAPPADQSAAPLRQIEVVTSPGRRNQRTETGAGQNVSPLAEPGDGRGNGPRTPLNSNAVATSASRLGLTAHETPATVEVVDQQTMQEQGYRTTAEAVNGAVGVLSLDAGGAPAGFQMRGFSFGLVNVLYNGISTGPQSITSRTMDTANLSQIEFLKGPSSLMTGMSALGGSVNYVNRQPYTGPIRSELDLSWDSLGTLRSHYGSGGSTLVKGLDYRFDVTGSRLKGYIDDISRDLTGVSTQLNYRVNDAFKTFLAVEYKRDKGTMYWGTPLVPVSFAGSNAVSGIVSGTALSAIDGSNLGPVTIDSRTRKTNYNTLDNSSGSEDLWLRTGFEWSPYNNLTVKNQTYYYQAKRHWLDSETYAFNTTTNSTIDRDRFFVGHDQRLVGNNTDLVLDTSFFGMDNRFATQIQASSNKLTFTQEGNPDTFPADTVDVINPDRGFYGELQPNVREKRLNTVAASFEDRLKVTPWLSLIGGLRVEHISLDSSGSNFDGTPVVAFNKSWGPVSYRAAFTIEPTRNLMFYGMTATAFDPAAAGIFSISPGTSLELTSSRIYEAGIKQLFWDGRAEWNVAAYDISRRNVLVRLSSTVFTLAGEVQTKGVELGGAIRPVEGLKLWGNAAFTEARYVNFDLLGFTGNTPSNVAPMIINAGASYRWASWRFPVEIGSSVRHVGRRFVFEDDATVMEPYTTADVYAFVDIPGREIGQSLVKDTRVAFRVRNITDKIYVGFSDPGYQSQVYLGAPRTFEVATSFRW